MTNKRTAVVVVHGMGNQRPMATMRAVINALYTEDPDIQVVDQSVILVGEKREKRLWAMLDRATSDLDLPVITTARIRTADGSERNIDFHEHYWAPVMAESRFVAVPLWLFELVRKGPATMRAGIKPLYWIIGFLLALWIVSAALLITTLGHWLVGVAPIGNCAWIWPWALAALLTLILMRWRGLLLLTATAGILTAAAVVAHCACGGAFHVPMAIGDLSWLAVALLALGCFVLLDLWFLETVVGDAARYYRATPANVTVRRAARSMGVDILGRLHAARLGGGYKYDRIIVVAHSLGTVVAYDSLRAYWSLVAKSLGDPTSSVIGEEQDNFPDLATDPDAIAVERKKWRNNARQIVRKLEDREQSEKVARRQGERERRWIVTDFVTMGSPLVHAPLLMANAGGAGVDDRFETKKAEREFPICPPEKIDQDGRLSFQYGSRDARLFHTGALFGVTRWTNLYFPLHAILWGDLVGGPIATDKLFGRGIEDVSVGGARLWSILAHTSYWNIAKPTVPDNFLGKLRYAVDLKDRDLAMDTP